VNPAPSRFIRAPRCDEGLLVVSCCMQQRVVADHKAALSIYVCTFLSYCDESARYSG
jgi:hypothetical protein